MRCLMLTLAAVLVAAVVELEAQGHGAPAAHAPKAEAHPPAKAEAHPPAKPGTHPPAKAEAPASTPPDVATVLQRISQHVAEVTDISKPRPGARPAPAREPKKSPRPQAPAHARAAAAQSTAHSRIELDWHTPLLVWPEELLRP